KVQLAQAGKPVPNFDKVPRDYSLLLWYGIEPSVAADPTGWATRIPAMTLPIVREFTARRILDVPFDQLQDRMNAVVHVLSATNDDLVRTDILTGMREALAPVAKPKIPAQWTETFEALSRSQNETVTGLADELGVKFGDPRAISLLTATMNDAKLNPARRQLAIARLAPGKLPDFPANMRKLLADPAVRGTAIKALANYSDAEIPAAILKLYASFTPEEKADAVITLAGRKDGARALLAAIEKKDIPKRDVTAFAARQIRTLNDRALSAKLEAVWGTVKPASATRVARTAKLKALLTAEYMKSANLTAGKAIFTKTCATCHKLYGEGNDVGPDLTGSQRANLDYVLENVLDPNAIVPYDLKMTAFYLADGRVITGLLKKETPQAITVRTVNDTVILSPKDIDSRKGTNLSLMPEGLLDPMKDDEIRDLIAYLAKK
ncbi:MAG TPA: c-type cytochrome, partial [Fimbriiglobus sp.]